MQNHATKTEKADAGWVLELPLHLICDILSRLPTKAIFSCRCVCKTFLNILTDPCFAELHLTKLTNYSLIIQDIGNVSNLFFVRMLDLESPSSPSSWTNDRQDCDSRPWQTLNMSAIVQSKLVLSAAAVGSCNGLVCLCYQLEKLTVLYVCNPILGEFMVLPQPLPRSTLTFSAFGFCPKTKQYKVIAFIDDLFCMILTLGTDYWRRIDNVPHPRTISSIDSCSLYGNLHWITVSSTVSNMICSFNLETEQYLYVSPPTHFNRRDIRQRITCIEVGVLGKLLCVSYLLDAFQFEVYVMKDYGVKESWTKKFTFGIKCYWELRAWCRNPLIKFLNNSELMFVKFLRSGDLLLGYLSLPLVYHSPRKETIRDILGLSWGEAVSEQFVEVYSAVDHVPSFISLKHIGRGGNVEVVERKKLRSFWSDKGI